MENFIEFKEIVDKKEREEILNRIVISLMPFRRLVAGITKELIKDTKIDIIIVRKRTCIIKGSSILAIPFDEEEKEIQAVSALFYLDQGNLFEIAGGDLKDGILKIEDLKGKTIPRIFSEGDFIYPFSPINSFFGGGLMLGGKYKKYHEDTVEISRCIVSGLPWERAENIHPVSLIRLTPMVNIVDLYKKDFFLGVLMANAYGSLLEEDFSLSQLRLWSQLTNRGKAKVAFILYNCFKGEMPVQWWKNLQGKELGEKDVDKKIHLLKKPREMIMAFAIEGKQLALLSGVTEKELEDLLIWSDKNRRNRFLEDSVILNDFLVLTVKEGVYFFSIRSKSSQKLNQGLLYKIHSKFLQELKRYFLP